MKKDVLMTIGFRVPDGYLNALRDEIYQDAVAHGLWEDEDGIDWYHESHSMIKCEVDELYDSIEDIVNGHGDEHFAEELADVIIMSMSVAGKLGIDIDAAIRRKLEFNKQRPWKHGKE
jgi:NTP pyrophosphatase (non-canonical NTP hydrolase)